VYLHADE